MSINDEYKAYYGPEADRLADQYKIPRSIFSSLIQQESSWNPNQYGTSGEYGFTQLMPGTASDLGVNRYDPIANLEGGAKYLSQQFQKFGTWRKALAAYNAGPGNIEAGFGYADEVIKRSDETATQAEIDQTPGTYVGPKPGEQEPITNLFNWSNILQSETLFTGVAIVAIATLIFFGVSSLSKSAKGT